MKAQRRRPKVLYLVGGVLAFLLLLRLTGTLSDTITGGAATTVPISEVAAGVKAGTIQRITLEEDRLSYQGADGGRYTARKEPRTTVSQLLTDYGVTPEQLNRVSIVVNAPSGMASWAGALIYLLPLVLFGALLVFVLRRGQAGNNQAMAF